MSSTAKSVTTFLTQPTPVRGKVHSVSSLDSPSRLLCCMATMMFSALATRSMAPPMPLTMRPGIFQLAMSPRSETSMAPSTVSWTLRARIMPKDVALSKSDAPASAVMVCFPALMRSASSSPSKGKGPMPRIPFSDWNSTSIPWGMKLATRVGIPMPRLTYQPLRSSWAMRRAIPFLSSAMA